NRRQPTSFRILSGEKGPWTSHDAEDSGEQSRRIGVQLSKITATISEIVSSSKLASDALDDVFKEIDSANQIVKGRV
ncbi:MAG: hypothetical protein IKN34_03395, partial [Treponema sp.]|nr:hypothetical protein [Treponema sp.]